MSRTTRILRQALEINRLAISRSRTCVHNWEECSKSDALSYPQPIRLSSRAKSKDPRLFFVAHQHSQTAPCPILSTFSVGIDVPRRAIFVPLSDQGCDTRKKLHVPSFESAQLQPRHLHGQATQVKAQVKVTSGTKERSVLIRHSRSQPATVKRRANLSLSCFQF